jgi:hypothetical protein
VIKLLYDHGSRRFLSCLAIGPDSSEIVNQACFCLSTNTPMESFLNISTIHPSPTEYMVRALRRRFDHNFTEGQAEQAPVGTISPQAIWPQRFGA